MRYSKGGGGRTRTQQASWVHTAVERGEDPWLLRMEVDPFHSVAASVELTLKTEKTKEKDFHVSVILLVIDGEECVLSEDDLWLGRTVGNQDPTERAQLLPSVV